MVDQPNAGSETGLVGRDGLVGWIEDEVAGAAPALVLRGPSGVGKTAVLRVAAEGHPERRVIWLGGSSATRRIPFGSIMPLIASQVSAEGGAIDELALAALTGTGSKPTLVLVDDLDLVDAGTANVLATVVSAERAQVVATSRSRGFDRIGAVPTRQAEVPALTFDETALLARRLVGTDLDPELASWLWRSTAGIPLYVQELVRITVRSRSISWIDGLAVLGLDPRSLPPNLDGLLALRVEDLDGGPQRVLDLLAVGGPLQLELLERLTGPEAVTAVRSDGLVEVVDRHGEGVVHITSAVVRGAVEGRIGVLERHRLVRSLVAAAEAPRTVVEQVQRARWQLELGTRSSPDEAAAAAGAAFAIGDHDLASLVGEQAIDGRQDEAGAELLFLLARVDAARGDEARSLDRFAQAQERCTDPLLLAEIVAHRARALAGTPGQAIRLITSALEGIEDPGLRGLLGLRVGSIALVQGQPARALEVLRAIPPDALAPPGRDHLDVLVLAASALHGDFSAAIAALERLDPDRPSGPPTGYLGDWPGFERVWHAFVLGFRGELEVGLRLAQREYDRGSDLRQATVQGWAAYVKAHLLARSGRLLEAARWYRRCLVVPADRSARLPLVEAALLEISVLVGDPRGEAAARSALGELSPAARQRIAVRVARTDGLVLRGDGAPPARVAEALRRGLADTERSGFGLLRFEALEALALHGVANEDEVAAIASSSVSLGGPGPAAVAAFARAVSAGRLESMGEAVAQLDALGLRWLAALAMETTGRVATEQHRAGEAMRWGRAARAQAEACGVTMDLLPPHPQLAALTRRERMVVDRIAGGRRTSAVATELHISSRTVENVLARAFEKLGVADRQALRELLG